MREQPFYGDILPLPGEQSLGYVSPQGRSRPRNIPNRTECFELISISDCGDSLKNPHLGFKDLHYREGMQLKCGPGFELQG